MFFGRRRKWNGKVAALLPAFDLSLDEVGPMKALGALDMVYPKGFTEQEGALYLAILCYPTFLKSDVERASKLRGLLWKISDDWIKLGHVNPRNVEAWKKKVAQWESGDFSSST